jgi:hypothetical protein
VIAYKFLRTGREGPFSAFRWPDPGTWVRATESLARCRCGVHACRPRDLPWWLSDELWEIELDGNVVEDEHKLVASAGALRSRAERWTPASAQDYGEACAWRARDRTVAGLLRRGHLQAADELAACTILGELHELARRLASTLADGRIGLTIAADGAFRALTGAPPTSAYIAAHAALRLDGATGYHAERQWQARWLTDRLGLPTA